MKSSEIQNKLNLAKDGLEKLQSILNKYESALNNIKSKIKDGVLELNLNELDEDSFDLVF